MAPILQFPSSKMRASFSPETLVKTGLLALVTAVGISASSGASAAGATLHVEQKSESASYGEWMLAIPGGANYTSALKTKVLTGLATGTYRLTVRPLAGVTSHVKLYNNNILKEETSATFVVFDLKDGDMYRATITYSRNGTVEVRSEPSGVAFVMESGNGTKFTGTTPAVFNDMVPTWYRVSYDLAADCQAQKQQERGLIEGSSLIFTVKLDCGSRHIATPGKTSKNLSTGAKPPVIATNESEVSAAERILQTSSVGEVLPGGRVRVTVSVRNVTATTLQNVRVTDRFNPNAIEILEIRDGGYVDQNELKWNIPQITAGATWTTTFDIRVKETVKTGERVMLMATVTSDTSDNSVHPEPAAPCSA